MRLEEVLGSIPSKSIFWGGIFGVGRLGWRFFVREREETGGGYGFKWEKIREYGLYLDIYSHILH